MKKAVLFSLFWFACAFIFAQQISNAEYFFDADPGQGNGIEISITPGQNINVSVSVSIDGLDPGFHHLYIRTKQNGIWGAYGPKRIFYIQPLPSGTFNEDVTDAEYFFDQDPGPGNGENIPLTPGSQQDVSFVASIDGLDPGFHHLYIRTKQNGIWGAYGPKRIFYVNQEELTFSLISKIEVFVDEDPGIGNGTVVDIEDGYTVSGLINLVTNGLDPGIHTLYIRAHSASGVVGQYITRPFSICEGGELSPLISSVILPECETDMYSVQVEMPSDWTGPAYTFSNNRNDQSASMAAGDSAVFGPFVSMTEVSFTAVPPEGQTFCPAVLNAVFECFDCQEMEVNNGDSCAVDSVAGEYIDCECIIYDCAGVLGGTASIDDCGICSGGSTGIIPNETCTDCEGVVNGNALPGEICYNGSDVGTYNENCECINNDLGSIDGHVDGLSGCDSRDFTISIFNADHPELNDVFTTTIDASGDFSSPAFSTGTYSVLVKIDGYLAQLYSNQSIVSGTNPLELTGIIAGDIDDSNSVNVVDVSFINAAFGTMEGDTAYNTLADLNCDGIVNVVDVSILNTTFGLVGDEAPTSN